MNRFLRRSAACAAVLAVFAAVGPARAACSTANQYNFSFANEAAATLSLATTYTYTATSTALGSQTFTVGFSSNGVTTTTVASTATPAIGTLITDGVAARNLVLGAIFGGRSNATFTSNYIYTTFTFPTPIRDFSVQLNDIDFTSNQFRDWVQVDGLNGASTYVPAITTPWSTNNTAAGPHTNASSSMVVGAVTTPFTVSQSQVAGTGASGNNSTTGTLTASFLEPVTSVRVRWGNYPLQTGETTTGQQAIGIQQISFCPMPALTVTKTSAVVDDPVNGTTNPKLIPGANVDYTITLTNSDSSPVDIVSAITDVLPAGTTFYNGDIDSGTAGTQNFVFTPGTSGLGLAAANVTYSNNAGATYAYTPAAGYDTNMQAIRFAPTSSMAANSTMSVRFRTQIK